MALSEGWRKSSYSGTNGQNCVEARLAPSGEGAQVRDSKLGNDSPILTVTEDQWATFLRGLNAGELNLFG